MSKVDDELRAIKQGTAILVTCLAQAAAESNSDIKGLFLDRLERAYRELKDNTEGHVRHQMELVGWVHEMITGWSFITGQGKPFLEK